MNSGKFNKGRGAQINTKNRFAELNLDKDFFEDLNDDFDVPDNPKTEYIKVHPKTIINKVPSPDIGMNWSMNPYQGCEHGCIYCYARNTHEYWGYSAGTEFEQKILYKPNIVELLTEKLNKKSWKPDPIMLSGNTDCYQPAERKFKLTRSVLEVFKAYNQPVGIITKNSLILRDLDIIEYLAHHNLIRVAISLTTLSEETRRRMEPRTASVKMRLKTIETLSKIGVPVIAQMGPVIPAITDHEIPDVVKAAADCGAANVSYIMVRLNGQVGPIFEDWVKKAYPDRAEKVLNKIKSMHGGKLNESEFGTRMRGEGQYAEITKQLFKKAQAKYLPLTELPPMDFTKFKRPGQMSLF